MNAGFVVTYPRQTVKISFPQEYTWPDGSIHAGIGLNHLNRISNLKHAFFNKKSFYIKVSWHVQELSDQSIKSELYAIIGRAIFRVLAWNVHEKPEHAAFQLSTCCSFFNIFKRK